MIRLQIINLFPKHNGPQVLANELYHVEGICHSDPIPRKAFHEPLANLVAQRVEAVKYRFALLIVVEGFIARRRRRRRELPREAAGERHELDQQ